MNHYEYDNETITLGQSVPGVLGAKSIRKQNAENEIVASQELDVELQSVLVDLLEVEMQREQAHWNDVCRNCRDTVDAEEPTSANSLHALIERLEQFASMVSNENRSPTTTQY